ncbi:hypothetical protein M9435_005088 [Picochlorum sp. BPE23]|nr:hypothetical protein M9435_005088 [Picochlorum sp. BPE23]
MNTTGTKGGGSDTDDCSACLVDVEVLLRSGAVPPGLAQRIRAADANQDGSLSVEELVEVMRSEQRAVGDRRLMRNFAAALFVAVLVLVATLCGTVYAIVKLTQEVNDNDGVLVSASTGEVMSTGLAQQRVEASRLYRFADPEELRSVESVLVPSAEDGSVTMFRVSKIRAVPNVSATVYTVDGTTLEVDDAGLVVVEQGDEGGASGRRLLLFADDPYAPTILGTTYSSRRGRIPPWCSRECDAAKRCGKYAGTKYNTCMDACERDIC